MIFKKNFKTTPLNMAINDRFRIFKLLINNGADVNGRNDAENTPLMNVNEAGNSNEIFQPVIRWKNFSRLIGIVLFSISFRVC